MIGQTGVCWRTPGDRSIDNSNALRPARIPPNHLACASQPSPNQVTGRDHAWSPPCSASGSLGFPAALQVLDEMDI